VDKRSIIALVLCFFIFIGWMWLQNRIWPPPKPQPRPVAAAPQYTPDKPNPDKPGPEKPSTETPAKPVPNTAPSRYDEKPSFTLRSKHLEAVVTNQGAGIERLTLHYPKPGDAVPILQPMGVHAPHLALRHVDGEDQIELQPWEIVEQKDDHVEFRYRLRNGVEITKILALEDGRHTVKMTLLLDNKNKPGEDKKDPADVEMKLDFLVFNGMDPDSLYRSEQYLMGAWRYDHSLHLKSVGEIEKGELKMIEALKMLPGSERENEIKSIEEKFFRIPGGRKEYFGVKNRFFTALLQPDDAALNELDYYYFRGLPAALQQNDRHNVVASARTNAMRVGPSRKALMFTVYAGPLDKEALREIPGAEDMAAYSGGCSPLAFVIKPAMAIIMELLHFTKSILGNMGVSIIITTLLIRLCLFPLSLKSQRNALQMQALSPKLQALKERYKDDQQKYGVEQMRLFKENGVNPVAGCLPLLIQMPIFIGMYSVFEMSLDLRHAPFFGWIKDLSEPDRLFGPWSAITIPLLITEVKIESFNLLPILMTITWFLQAFWTPRSPDPQMAQQQKMMMWMPIVFGLTCYGLASGLSLYFLSNSLLSMGEQKIIKRYILKVDATGKPLFPKVSEGGSGKA